MATAEKQSIGRLLLRPASNDPLATVTPAGACEAWLLMHYLPTGLHHRLPRCMSEYFLHVANHSQLPVR